MEQSSSEVTSVGNKAKIVTGVVLQTCTRNAGRAKLIVVVQDTQGSWQLLDLPWGSTVSAIMWPALLLFSYWEIIRYNEGLSLK